MPVQVPPSIEKWTNGLRVGPIAPIGGVVDIGADQLDGRHPSDFSTFVITSTAAFTVMVETPNPGVYADNPMHAVVGADANKLVLNRGRWPSIRITTAGNVYLIADVSPEAWQT